MLIRIGEGNEVKSSNLSKKLTKTVCHGAVYRLPLFLSLKIKYNLNMLKRTMARHVLECNFLFHLFIHFVLIFDVGA